MPIGLSFLFPPLSCTCCPPSPSLVLTIVLSALSHPHSPPFSEPEFQLNPLLGDVAAVALPPHCPLCLLALSAPALALVLIPPPPLSLSLSLTCVPALHTCAPVHLTWQTYWSLLNIQMSYQLIDWSIGQSGLIYSCQSCKNELVNWICHP